MARSKKPADGKTESLKKYGALNPHPQKVVETAFSDSAIEFFDPRDLVQVKYEMLRFRGKERPFGETRIRDFRVLAPGLLSGAVAVQTGGRGWSSQKEARAKIRP